MRSCLIFLSLLFTTACSIAPMGPTHTARTNGAGESNFNFGTIGKGFYSQTAIGIHKDLDIGFVFEFGNYTTSGITLKYAPLNYSDGLAFAFEAAYGGSDKSSYNYLGTILSTKLGSAIELFINGRYNTVKVDKDEYDIGEDIGLVELKDYNFNYWYLAYGLNIWPVQDIGLSIYSASVLGREIKEKSNSVGMSLLFKI